MKKVNSLSGGKTSSYLAVHYPADYNVFSVVCTDDVDCKVKDEGLLSYARKKLSIYDNEFGVFNATLEDDKTLRVMADLEQYIGSNIEWVRGESFDSIIDNGTHTRLPSWARRYCTSKMKLLPIFLWWFNKINEKCEMRIGFRFDEYMRMERFFNNSNPINFSIPTSCSIHGSRRQKFESFNWRYCSFPMIKDGITKSTVDEYWNGKIAVKHDLFNDERLFDFPLISNCIGCFHKSEETLAVSADLNPEKFKWFMNQELKGMGTFLDTLVTYQHISNNRHDIAKEQILEAKIYGQHCDSGGCTE